MAARESVDTLGLVVVKHTIEENPKAECVGHFPTHVVETSHEIVDGETVGEMLARLGLDEGDRIEIRFPTVAEDRAKLAAVIAAVAHQPLKDDGSTRCTLCGGFTLHFEACAADRPDDHLTNERPAARRDRHGVPLDRVRWEQWPETEGAH